jgi:hypothetical protein
LTAWQGSARVKTLSDKAVALFSSIESWGFVRAFLWWFCMGCLMTLAVLMVQGGVRDLISGASQVAGPGAVLSFGTTIFGGGLLAGCLALILNRLR